MGMPAKSAKLTLLEGNSSRYTKAELERRIENEEKLKMRADNIIAPNWLSADAKKEFNRLAEILLECEVITEADINILALYCDALSEYKSCIKEIKAKGKWVGDKPNPFYVRKEKAFVQLKSAGTELGLSPSARAKLAINMNSEEDDEIDF
jgi:P27 family predicted phage terminase small subunit